jgi:hypothetical protein
MREQEVEKVSPKVGCSSAVKEGRRFLLEQEVTCRRADNGDKDSAALSTKVETIRRIMHEINLSGASRLLQAGEDPELLKILTPRKPKMVADKRLPVANPRRGFVLIAANDINLRKQEEGKDDAEKNGDIKYTQSGSAQADAYKDANFVGVDIATSEVQEDDIKRQIREESDTSDNSISAAVAKAREAFFGDGESRSSAVKTDVKESKGHPIRNSFMRGSARNSFNRDNARASFDRDRNSFENYRNSFTRESFSRGSHIRGSFTRGSFSRVSFDRDSGSFDKDSASSEDYEDVDGEYEALLSRSRLQNLGRPSSFTRRSMVGAANYDILVNAVII